MAESGKNQGKVGKGKPPVHSRFKPGQSGNPKGRPPEPLILKDLRAACKAADEAGVIFDALMKLVKKGNVRAIELMAHYGAGKPADTLLMTVPAMSHEEALKFLK